MTTPPLSRSAAHDAANRDLDTAILSSQQTLEAVGNLMGDPNDAVRFPYDSLNAIVGKIATGRLVFLMANTGQGKTTLLLDAFDRWAQAGVRMDYLGTEQEPSELRQKWACLRVGVPAHVAINREWDDHRDGEAWKEKVWEDLGKLDDAYGDQVLFVPDKFITVGKIEDAAKRASERGAKVLIVDHIDRVETGATENEYLVLKRLTRRLKELARDCHLVMLVASQMNRKGREGDRLSAYRPPQLHHMQGGGMKEQEADVVLGVWRPIRQQVPGETPKEYKAAVLAAASGATEPQTVLEQNTMAVVCLKHRTAGGREGQRCKLHLEHGRLTDMNARDQHSGMFGYQP